MRVKYARRSPPHIVLHGHVADRARLDQPPERVEGGQALAQVRACIMKYARGAGFDSRTEGACVLVNMGSRRAPEEFQFKAVADLRSGYKQGFTVTCTSCAKPEASVVRFIESDATEIECMRFMSALAEEVIREEIRLRHPTPAAPAQTKPKPVDTKGKNDCVIC
jgi:hypothetical protein